MVRRSLGIEFDGFTWPERFLVVSTPFDFHTVIPDLAAVSYVADPERWHFLLQIPGLCRVMFPIAPSESDELALDREFAQSLMATVRARAFTITRSPMSRSTRCISGSRRLSGRAGRSSPGDAAHINNPLGGMGMNGGIHDAINLTERLAAVWHDDKPEAELDRYDKQRRLVTLEYIEKQSIQNKRNLEIDRSPNSGRACRTIAADPGAYPGLPARVSMIASLRRAEELG